MKQYFSSYWIRSAFYTFLQRFSLTFFGLINFIILIWSLSKDQMGTWALFLVVTTIFETTKSGLLKNAHIRFVAGSTEAEEKTVIASSSLIINAAISIVFISFLLLFRDSLSAWLHTGPDLSMMLLYFIPGLIGMVFFSHLEAIQQSHFDFKGVFAGHFIRQIIFFSAICAHYIFKKPFSLSHLALYQSAGIIVGTVVLYFYSRKYIRHRFHPTKAATRKIVGYGGYIFGSGILANIFANVDQLMTATYMKSPTYVAYYNAASRINGFVDIPSYAASEILFPKVSQASALEGNRKVKYLYERMVAILLSFTIPASLFIIFFPEFVITLIAGSQYIDAAPILQLYMATGILRPLQNQSANILNSIGKQKICFYINAISLAANLLINYICFINFGFYGAAIGTLITCVLGTTAWYLIMRRQISLELVNIFHHIIDFYRILLNYASRIFPGKKKTPPVEPS